MRKALYLIDQENVTEIDVSYMPTLVASDSYMIEHLCAYVETPEQALYCAILYDHNLIDKSNTVIDGETWGVLTLPRISVKPFKDAPRYDDLRGTLYISRRNGHAWIDYQREQSLLYKGHSESDSNKQLLSCDLPVDCTVTELKERLHDLRHLIVAAALSPDRDTAIERERILRRSIFIGGRGKSSEEGEPIKKRRTK